MNNIAGLAAALIMAAACGLRAEQGGTEVMTKLGLDPAAAREGVLVSLANGTVYNEAAFKAFKSLPGAARASIVRSGLAWIKTYVSGDEFKTAYRELRERQKPLPPEARPAADEQMAKMNADMEKSIAEIRKSMAAMDGETKKAMEASILEMRAQMERMQKDEGQRKLMGQMVAMSDAEDKKRHEEKLKEWERRYPADARTLIRQRIRDFLEMSRGVDFGAKLVARKDKMVFADEKLEAKPAEWKLCFRAGKEATGAARAFAEGWLAELDKI